MTCALLLGLLPTAAWAADDVPYLDRHWDESAKQVITENKTVSNPTTVTASGTTWTAGWYVASGEVNITSRITVTGDVHLILTDGCNLTASDGIRVEDDDANIANGSANRLTIYGQSGGTGQLTAVSNSTHWSQAGIGGGVGNGNGGAGGVITINGGTVTATSSSYGAGIGGGSSSKSTSGEYDPGGAGGSITITGGTVKATSQRGAGIGGGKGINGGDAGESGTFSTTSSGSAFITASSIGDNDDKTSWSGVIFEGKAGQIYGSPTLTTNAEIPSGKTLTIPEGSSLTIDPGVTLTNNGTITNSGAIVNNGNLDNQNTITNSGSGSYSGTGTVDKSTPTVIPPTPKTGLTYNGSAQALINAGRASAGTLKYSTDGTSYSTDIPTGASVRDYTVYYKVEGNAYYNDVAEQSVSVPIAKAAPTVSAAVSLSGSAGAREAALTVTVTGVANGAAPTGTVTLTDIGQSKSLTLNNGTASYTWTGLADKDYTVTVTYGGDDNYDTASIKKTLTPANRSRPR